MSGTENTTTRTRFTLNLGHTDLWRLFKSLGMPIPGSLMPIKLFASEHGKMGAEPLCTVSHAQRWEIVLVIDTEAFDREDFGEVQEVQEER